MIYIMYKNDKKHMLRVKQILEKNFIDKLTA